MAKVGELIVEFKVKDTGSKQLKNIQNQVSSLGSTIQIALGNIAAQAFLTLGDYASEVFDTYSTGVGVTEGFNALVEDQEGLLDDLKEATNDEVSALDLMKTANVGLMAEMTPDQLVEVAAAAEQLAEVTGVTTTQAFDELVTGIARGSPRILDNLGIFVDGEQALEDYADELGVTTDEMTRVERQTAIMNIALDKSNEIQDKVADSNEDLGDKTQQLKARLSNLTNELGSNLTPAFGAIVTIAEDFVIPVIEKVMGVVGKFVNFLDQIGFFDLLTTIGSILSTGFGNIIGGFGNIVDFLSGLTGGGGKTISGGGNVSNNVTQYVTVNTSSSQPSPEISNVWGDAMLRSLTPNVYVTGEGVT